MTNPFEDYFMYIVTPLAADSYKNTDIDKSLIYHSGEELSTATVGTSTSASAETRNKAVFDVPPSLAKLPPTSRNCRQPRQLSLVAPIIVSNQPSSTNEKRLLVNLPAPIIIRPCTSTSSPSQAVRPTKMTEKTSKLGNSAKNINIFPLSSIPMPIICSGANSLDNQYSLKMSHKDLIRAQNDVLPNFMDRQGHQQLYSDAAQLYCASQLPSDGVIAANKMASLITEVKKESLRRPSEGSQSDHMTETMLRSAMMGTKQKLDELLAGSDTGNGTCLGSLPIEIKTNPELRNFSEIRDSTEIRRNSSTSCSRTDFKVQPSTSKTSLFPTPISTPINFSPSPESSENQQLSQLYTPDALSSEDLAAKCATEPHSSSEEICQIPSGFDSSGRLLSHIKTSIRSEIEQRREFLITVRRKQAVDELKEKLRHLFPPGTGSALIQRLSIDYSGVQREQRKDIANSEKENIIKCEIGEDHKEERKNCSKRHRPHPVQISDGEMRQMRNAIERKMRKIDGSRLCS